MTNPNGRFGIHGGQYIPETLMNAVKELEEAYKLYTKPYIELYTASVQNPTQRAFAKLYKTTQNPTQRRPKHFHGGVI